MRKLFIIIFLFLFLLITNDLVIAESVNGYFKRNGTYVQPYIRSPRNNTILDNYSTRGNTNPYTGRRGYINPSPNTYDPDSAFRQIQQGQRDLQQRLNDISRQTDMKINRWNLESKERMNSILEDIRRSRLERIKRDNRFIEDLRY